MFNIEGVSFRCTYDQQVRREYTETHLHIVSTYCVDCDHPILFHSNNIIKSKVAISFINTTMSIIIHFPKSKLLNEYRDQLCNSSNKITMIYSKEKKVRAIVSNYLLDKDSSENMKGNNCCMKVPSEYHMVAEYLYQFLRSKDAFKLETKIVLYLLWDAMGLEDSKFGERNHPSLTLFRKAIMKWFFYE